MDLPKMSHDQDVVIVEPENEINDENVKGKKDPANKIMKKRKLENDDEKGQKFNYIGETSRSAYERGGGAPKRPRIQETKITHFKTLCVTPHRYGP